MKHTSQDSPANPYNVYYDNYMDTAADTECTGLIHRAVNSQEEWEHYKELVNFIPASPGSYPFSISEDTE